jgi:hypothetical protein
VRSCRRCDDVYDGDGVVSQSDFGLMQLHMGLGLGRGSRFDLNGDAFINDKDADLFQKMRQTDAD